MCVYRGYSLNVATTTLDNLTGTRDQASRFGLIVEDGASAKALLVDSGTWAFTAP